ncbi:transposase [Elusimicrobiota bacterium]
MGRRLRFDHPNLCHHVMARGNNKAKIFLDGEDYARGKLSGFMRRLLGGYAREFNRRHGRVGHVFQGRFRSRLVLENNYMLELSRYINMNPVKAGLAERPEDYPWSSFPGLWGRRSSVPVARELYEQRFPGPSGPEDFYRFTVARLIPDADPAGWPDHPDWYVKEPPAAKALSLQGPEGPDPRVLLELVASRFGCPVETLTGAWRDPRLGAARAAAMLALRDQGGLSLREIASLLGLRSPRSVSNALRCRRRMSA